MSHPYFRTSPRYWLVALALTLSSCASTAPREIAANTPDRVWPSAPATPRIAYVRSISSPADLSIGKGFFTRVLELVFGEEKQDLVRPMSVVEVDKLLYVGDPGAGGIHRFDRAASSYKLLQAEGGVRMPSPVGIARGPAGSVYVTDSALRAVFILRPGAEYAVRLPLSLDLRQPTGVAFDPVAQALYVTDTANHCIQVFSPEGVHLRTLGRRGSGDGEFNFPTMLWLGNDGHLLVTDSLNFRTQRFDTNGVWLGKFGHGGDAIGDSPRQKGVAADQFGHIYVVDSILQAVQIFDGSGQLLLSIGGMGQAPGEFWLPTGIAIGSDGLIYIADTYNRRVQVFRYLGDPS